MNRYVVTQNSNQNSYDDKQSPSPSPSLPLTLFPIAFSLARSSTATDCSVKSMHTPTFSHLYLITFLKVYRLLLYFLQGLLTCHLLSETFTGSPIQNYKLFWNFLRYFSLASINNILYILPTHIILIISLAY